MSAQFTPQQITQQNATFKQALDNREISQAQYNAAMSVQNANLAAYNAAQQQRPYGDVGHNPDKPLERVAVYTPPIQPQQVQQQQQGANPLGFIQSVVINPIGTISSILNPVRDVLAKDTKSPTNQVALAYAGAVGEAVNTAAKVQNAFSDITNGKTQLTITSPVQPKLPNLTLPTTEKQLPYSPKTEAEQFGATAFKVGSESAITAATILVAPELMGARTVEAVRAVRTSIEIGAGIGAGLNQAPNVIKAVQGQPVTAKDVIESGVEGATEGALFSLVGGKIMQVTGLEGKTGVVARAERIGVNTALGGGAGMLEETIITGKNTGSGALQGAMFGAAFGLTGEVAGFVGGKLEAKYNIAERINENIPIPKYGKVIIPSENSEVTWRGLYLSQASEAKPIIGRYSDGELITKDFNVSPSFVPRSNIESTITQDVMTKAGYSPDTLQAIGDVRTVMRTTQFTRPQNINEAFPAQTKTLSEAGTSIVKEFILENKGNVDMVYGSYATKPQLSESFEFIKGESSALREPGDIDIQLRTNSKGAEQFANELVSRLQAKGESVRISPEKPTLIEADVGKGDFVDPTTVHHAVDIHFKDEPTTDVTNPVTEGAWGFTFAKKPVTIEKIPAMALNEQGLRKGASIMGFTEDQTIGPKSWRNKDIPDFFQAQKTLLDTMPKTKTGQAYEAFERARNYYDVTDAKMVNTEPERFVYNPNSKSSTSPSIGLSYPTTYNGAKENSPNRSPERSSEASPNKASPNRSYNVDSKNNYDFASQSAQRLTADMFLSVPVVIEKGSPQRGSEPYSKGSYYPSVYAPQSNYGYPKSPSKNMSPPSYPSSPDSSGYVPDYVPNPSPPSVPSPSPYPSPPNRFPSPPPPDGKSPSIDNKYFSLPGNQAKESGFSLMTSNKTKAKSYKFTNPLLEGFQLIGEKESGEAIF